jgi:hypothetical protein
LIVSGIGVGIDCWQKYPIEEFGAMGSEEFEFSCDQRILG